MLLTAPRWRDLHTSAYSTPPSKSQFLSSVNLQYTLGVRILISLSEWKLVRSSVSPIDIFDSSMFLVAGVGVDLPMSRGLLRVMGAQPSAWETQIKLAVDTVHLNYTRSMTM